MSKTMSEMLEQMKQGNTAITIITANGYQMNGTIDMFDTDCIIFKDARSGRTQIVLLSNISTISANTPSHNKAQKKA